MHKPHPPITITPQQVYDNWRRFRPGSNLGCGPPDKHDSFDSYASDAEHSAHDDLYIYVLKSLAHLSPEAALREFGSAIGALKRFRSQFESQAQQLEELRAFIGKYGPLTATSYTMALRYEVTNPNHIITIIHDTINDSDPVKIIKGVVNQEVWGWFELREPLAAGFTGLRILAGLREEFINCLVGYKPEPAAPELVSAGV